MRTTTTARIGAVGTGALLALGLFAASPPAGATGTHGTNSADAACFTATGQTQGRSHSDPDGMSNGGADKPGCTGGFDADRDGNNGCGNDADREDDNKGWCGHKPKPATDQVGGPAVPAPTTTSSTTTTSTTTPSTTSDSRVTPLVGTGEPTDCQVDPKEATGCTAAAQTAGTGDRLTAAAGDTGTAGAGTTADSTAAAAPTTEVLGETLSRPSALARTGAGVGGMALLGLVLCGSGRLALLARRLLRIG